MRRILVYAAAFLVICMLAIQLVPYGRDHTNPPVIAEPAWDSAATRDLAVAACFDCHSNETRWPLYASIAPFSWLLQRSVDEGRATLNFSEWGTRGQEGDDMVEVVREGRMPPLDYLLLHPEARISDAVRQAFLDGLSRTFGAGESRHGEGDDD